MLLEIINYLIICNNLIFILGLTGIFLNKKHVLMLLIAIEIVFLSINLNFIEIALYFDDFIGFIFVIFILTIAAVESAVVLALTICVHRFKKLKTTKNKTIKKT